MSLPVMHDVPGTRPVKTLRPIVSAEASAALDRIEAWLELERQRRTIVARDGHLEAIEEAGGGRSEYAYDRRGDLIRLTEANGQTTCYAYDHLRRISEVLHPGGGRTRYQYGDNDRLTGVDDDGVVTRFEHDAQGRVLKVRPGNTGASVYRYDAAGRPIEAHTSSMSERYEFDRAGRVCAIHQTFNGAINTVRLRYDEAGRLSHMWLPGSTTPIDYRWDAQGRPTRVTLGHRPLAGFAYDDAHKTVRVDYANGITETTQADAVDARPVRREARCGDEILFERQYAYDTHGQLIGDGVRDYDHDPLGRLMRAADVDGGHEWQYAYDLLDNRISAQHNGDVTRFEYDARNRLIRILKAEGTAHQLDYDRSGRPICQSTAGGQWTYRYNDAGQLVHTLYRGDTVARCEYDHKGRLFLLQMATRVERYVYGPADELLAVTDEQGRPLRLYVQTPVGILAEVHGSLDSGAVYFRHQDDWGNGQLVTDANGRVVARFDYAPFGMPISTSDRFLPIYGGRFWQPQLDMYYFGARWYKPQWARFLTPDSYTGGPDDARLVNGAGSSGQQALTRDRMIVDWLKQPRVRNRYAFCGNDPIGRSDPNGHWSFGWIMLYVLGSIWSLPNTALGLILEILCWVGELFRWLVYAVTIGHAGSSWWETPGFDAAASSRLNSWAIVFSGGWFGSIPRLMAMTFGNVFFVYKKWDQTPDFGGPGDVFPEAYGGKVTIPLRQALYEHELRHVEQQYWLGPFYYLLPIPPGIYGWSMIFGSYCDSWFERDARAHAGV